MVMVRRWLEYTNKSYWMNGILYFTPITDTRLRGSQQRTIEMLREFLNPIYPGNFLCLTTMWDTLSNERIKQRAEYNFVQLRDGRFKGNEIMRFMNTQTSALQILNKNRPIIQPFTQPFSSSVSRPLLSYRNAAVREGEHGLRHVSPGDAS
ncbi:hypothetical protein BJ165DRAFT_1427118 [Panaeolus papilionaceus]|nr:hypothetical protein BJ165DRAFT_1427118 [Panaeolus papilionaceus]